MPNANNEHDDFNGRSFTTQRAVENFNDFGFNDRASAVVVSGQPWEVCDDAGFRGHCYILRPGNYPSLSSMGLGERISSARWVDRNGQFAPDRWAPQPLPGQVTLYARDNFRGPSFSTTSDTFHPGKVADDQIIAPVNRDRVGGP